MFHLSIVTPEEIVFEGEIRSVTVPGKSGYFEVLKDHAPIISTLRSGKITVTDSNENKTEWSVSGGVIEVSHNDATLLADLIR